MNGGIDIGIGKGAAQVFDTFRYTQAIQRQLELNDAKERQEQQEIASILSKYNPEGMRDKDLGGFYKDYSELKSLYMTNKGLYSHPADHPQDFARAQALEQNLRMRSSMSKEFKQLEGKVGQDLYKDRNKFEKGTFDKWNRWGTQSLEEIMMEHGGVLPGYQDVEYKPIEPDHEKWQKRALGLGEQFVSTKNSIIRGTGETSKGGNGIQLGYAQARVDHVIKPEAFSILTNAMWADDGEEKRWYTKAFSQLDQDHLAEVQSNVDKVLGAGSTFKVHDPKSLAYADLLVRNSTIKGTESLVSDKQFDLEQKQSDHKRDRAEKRSDMTLERGWKIEDMETAHQNKLDEIEARKKNEEAENNKFVTDLNTVKAGLMKGDVSTANKLLGEMSGNSDLASVPKLMNPKTVSETDFVNHVRVMSKRTDYAKERISEEEAKEAYKNGTILVQLEVKDDDKEEGTRIVLLNPTKSTFRSKIAPYFKKGKVSLTKNDRAEGIDNE